LGARWTIAFGVHRLFYSLSFCRFIQLIAFAPTIISAPELNGWYASLHSGKGPCCEGADAKRVDDVDWDTKDDHYRVRIDGEWVDVPKDAVVDGPSRAAARWSGLTIWMVIRRRAALCLGA
jgi:hypothetical protein